MKKLLVATLVSLLIIHSVSIACLAGVLSPDLQSALQPSAPSEEVSVIITLSDHADLSLIKEEKDKHLKRSRIIQELKDKADRTHGPLKAFLEGRGSKRIVPLWIINGIAATVPAWMISELADFPGVDGVDLDFVIEAPPVTLAAAAPPEWNISAINAPDLWNIGFAGSGTVVANTDTGVDIFHPDLNSKWRGGTNSWFNPYSDPANAGQCAIPNNCFPCELSSSTPCDINGHGTGTMGIMVGGSAGGTAIGVAPDAKWIAVKVLNDAGRGPSSIILLGFQWMLDLPPAEAPDVVNNSWGFDPGVCNTTFQNSINTMKTAGIAVVFAAGNSGPSPATSVSPGNNEGAFAVGATDIDNTIASFSSRGPSPLVAGCGNGSIFPHVVAPGVNVRTSDITSGGLFPNSYVNVFGTSFSGPHAAGAMALLLGAFPSLTPTELGASLEQRALDLGTPGPDNNYGYGLIDIANAYKAAFNTINGNVPEIASLPSSYNFGNVEILSSPSNLFTIVNRGTADLSITNVSITGPDSSEFIKQNAGDACSGQTLPSLSSCSVPVMLSPTSVGPKSAALSIQSNDPLQSVLDVSLIASVFAHIPGTTVSAPALTWDSTAQKLYIAVRGGNGGNIWIGSISSTGTFNNDWTQIPGATSDAPAIAWNPANGKLQIAVKGANTHNLFVANMNADGTGFSGYTQITPITGGTTLSAPAIAWNSTTNRLQIAVRGNGNGIYVGNVAFDGTGFGGWTQLSGATSAAPSIAWNPVTGKVQLVVKGNFTNNIFVGNVNSDGTGFSGWTLNPGGTSTSPSLAWNAAAQESDVAVRGINSNNIWVGSIDSSGVFNNDFTQVAGAASPSAPSAAFNSLDNKLHILIRKAGNTIEEWAIQ